MPSGDELITDIADRETPQLGGWALSYPNFIVLKGKDTVFTLSGKGPAGGPTYISFKITITDGIYSHESPVWEILNDDQYRGVFLEAILENDWSPTTTTIFITIIIPPNIPPFSFNGASLTQYYVAAKPQYLPIMGVG